MTKSMKKSGAYYVVFFNGNDMTIEEACEKYASNYQDASNPIFRFVPKDFNFSQYALGNEFGTLDEARQIYFECKEISWASFNCFAIVDENIQPVEWNGNSYMAGTKKSKVVKMANVKKTDRESLLIIKKAISILKSRSKQKYLSKKSSIRKSNLDPSMMSYFKLVFATDPTFGDREIANEMLSRLSLSDLFAICWDADVDMDIFDTDELEEVLNSICDDKTSAFFVGMFSQLSELDDYIYVDAYQHIRGVTSSEVESRLRDYIHDYNAYKHIPGWDDVMALRDEVYSFVDDNGGFDDPYGVIWERYGAKNASTKKSKGSRTNSKNGLKKYTGAVGWAIESLDEELRTADRIYGEYMDAYHRNQNLDYDEDESRLYHKIDEEIDQLIDDLMSYVEVLGKYTASAKKSKNKRGMPKETRMSFENCVNKMRMSNYQKIGNINQKKV